MYVPQLTHNLYSLTQLMAHGGPFIGENNSIKAYDGKKVILFNTKIETKNRYILAAIIEPIGKNEKKKNIKQWKNLICSRAITRKPEGFVEPE